MSNSAYARCKAVVDYWLPRKEHALVTVDVSDLKVLLDEIDTWRTKLSQVMPPDFGDWFQNNPEEWPEVAANVILNLRKEIDYWSSID